MVMEFISSRGQVANRGGHRNAQCIRIDDYLLKARLYKSKHPTIGSCQGLVISFHTVDIDFPLLHQLPQAG